MLFRRCSARSGVVSMSKEKVDYLLAGVGKDSTFNNGTIIIGRCMKSGRAVQWWRPKIFPLGGAQIANVGCRPSLLILWARISIKKSFNFIPISSSLLITAYRVSKCSCSFLPETRISSCIRDDSRNPLQNTLHYPLEHGGWSGGYSK